MKRKTSKVSFNTCNCLELKTDFDESKFHKLHIPKVHKINELNVDPTILRYFTENQQDSQVLEEERIEKMINENYIDRITFWISLLEQAYRRAVSYHSLFFAN